MCCHARFLQGGRAFECCVHEHWPKLRKPSCGRSVGQHRPASRALQGVPPDAISQPRASLEAQIHVQDRQQACPVGCVECPCPAVQLGRAGFGRCFGYHVDPYQRGVAVPVCRAPPVRTQSRGLDDGAEHESRWFAMPFAWQSKRAAAAAELIVHSDRGIQYTSYQYQALLAEHNFICSISGKCK